MKSILIVLGLVISFSSYSQLDIKEDKTVETELGDVNIMGTSWISCKEFKEDSTAKYMFMYKNTKYSTINDYKAFWIYNVADFNQLYQVITDQLLKREDKELEITLMNEDKLTLKFTRKGVIQFMVWDGVALSYTYPFKQKHIDKLFGKV